MARILLIDDDPALIPKQVRRTFPAPLHSVEVARTGGAGIDCVRAHPPDVILLDVRLPDRSGILVHQEIVRFDARIPVIFITFAKTADTAIEAMRQGAYDYLFKPLDLHELQRTIGMALEAARRMRTPSAVAETPSEADVAGAIIGTCPAMREVYKAVGRVASQNIPVLITGESGTGKELVALAIYHHGNRSQSPFLALNCAAIAETLQESELFGHEKGAFTGADRRRIGKFEKCNQGTLFLDEIGDMPLPLQSKILRVLQEQVFDRVGGNEQVRTDVRVIAATHRDLKAWSEEGKFRADLYYRLSVVTIHLPPLRERGDDLELLVHAYVRRFNQELGRDVSEIAKSTMDRLGNYSWPGNIRELQSVLKQAILKDVGPTLLPEFLPDELSPQTEAGAERAPPIALGDEGHTLHQMERDAIQRYLLQANGNRQQAARLLGISTRTLLRKIREHNLTDPLQRSGHRHS